MIALPGTGKLSQTLARPSHSQERRSEGCCRLRLGYEAGQDRIGEIDKISAKSESPSADM